MPDLTSDLHLGWTWGHLELSGVLGYAKWDDLGDTSRVVDLSGDAVRWA